MDSAGVTRRMNVLRFIIVINYCVQLTYLYDQWSYSKRHKTLKIVYDTFELHSRKIKKTVFSYTLNGLISGPIL